MARGYCTHGFPSHGKDCPNCNLRCICGHLNGDHFVMVAGLEGTDNCGEEDCECPSFEEDFGV